MFGKDRHTALMMPSREFDGNPISESRQDLARQTHPQTRCRDPSLQWRPSGHSLALGSGPCDCGECGAATRNFIPKRRAANLSRCPLGSRAACPSGRLVAPTDAVIMKREGRITGLEQTHLQWAPTEPLPEKSFSRRRGHCPVKDISLVWALASPAIASGPERARWTGGPLVINAFFVRTPDNSVRHHNGPSSGRVDKREHFFCYTGMIADIGAFGEPAP
jgi:hypothetical protein